MQLSKLCGLAAAAALTSADIAMAAATQVNIADPKAANRQARVEIGSRLAVQAIPPASFFHQGGAVSSAGPCITLATAPGTQALVVTQLRINVTAIGATGGSNNITFFLGAECNEVVGEVDPNAIGLVTMTFGPGLLLRPGEPLAATAFGSPRADIIADGYTVDSANAP